MDRQGVMGVPDSRVEEVTRALEAMDDMIWSEGVAERVARVALAADAVEGDRPRPVVQAIEAARDDRLRAIARSERRIDKAQEAAIADYITVLYSRLRSGGGVEPSREFRPPTPLERALADSAAHWQARVVELEAALRELVTLKDGPRDEDYARRKPLAWERARALAAAGEGEDREAKCDLCGHEWRRHDPEDGRCDAHTSEPDEFGPCPCGRDLAWVQRRIAGLSRAALASGSRLPEQEDQ